MIGPVEIPTLMPPVPPAESAAPLQMEMEQAASPEPDIEVPTGPYRNCEAVRAAGAAPIHASDPGFDVHFDGDGDRVGCE